MIRYAPFGVLMWLLIAPLAPAQQKQTGITTANSIVLGRLANGAAVAFVRTGSGGWGIEISGAALPRLMQPKPAQIEVYQAEENVRQLAAGYQSVQKEADAVVASAKVTGGGGAAFAVEDRWKISGAVLSLSRKVSVTGAENNAGFYSAIRLVTEPKLGWTDADYLAPGLLYGEPHTSAGAPGGSLYYRAKRLSIREDYLPAPVFALSFRDGHWTAVLDMAPRGDTTQAETTAPAATPIIDERLQFGALGAREVPEGGVEFGFWLPGTTNEFSGGFFGGGRGAPSAPVVRRRYHPVKAGFSQSYQVGFGFGQGASLRGMERDAWRWAWQREDGSFPGSWQGGTGQVRVTSGVTTYAAVPVLVRMTEETGDKKYLNSAIRAADYIWTNFGSRCVFLGATGGEVADKESGMLSLEAFLALYENTKEPKWLERAKTAGDYTESWIWIWNVPMPLDAKDSELAWKRGVPTVGVQGIASNVAGHVDQYLDWAVPSYARLYKHTKDEHYLDVARVLLHGTKAMLALPGRTYNLLGPGWQQEHWRMGPGVRGIGAHRTWLPWVSVNHLHGITGLEEFDQALYQRLAKGR